MDELLVTITDIADPAEKASCEKLVKRLYAARAKQVLLSSTVSSIQSARNVLARLNKVFIEKASHEVIDELEQKLKHFRASLTLTPVQRTMLLKSIYLEDVLRAGLSVSFAMICAMHNSSNKEQLMNYLEMIVAENERLEELVEEGEKSIGIMFQRLEISLRRQELEEEINSLLLEALDEIKAVLPKVSQLDYDYKKTEFDYNWFIRICPQLKTDFKSYKLVGYDEKIGRNGLFSVVVKMPVIEEVEEEDGEDLALENNGKECDGRYLIH